MTPPLWNAVHALRVAEALAGLGTVSGPADAPPSRPDDEDSWVRDWIQRGKEALQKAREMHAQGVDVLKERAGSIAKAIRDGAEAVRRGVHKVATGTLAELDELQRTAQAAANAWSGTMAVGVLLILGALALYYLPRRRRD